MNELSLLASTDLTDVTAVKKCGQELEEILLNKQESYITELSAEEIIKLQQLYECFETNLETEFANKVLKEKAKIEDYPLYQRFKRLVAAEIKLANITSHDKILFIGSGPFPISPILLATLTGSMVDCFDISEEACIISKGVINAIGLSNKIKVYKKSGEKGAVQRYDVIDIALLAQPKENILNNLWENASHGARVICRNAEGFRLAFYKGINPETFKRSEQFDLIKQHNAGPDDTISSLLLKIHKM